METTNQKALHRDLRRTQFYPVNSSWRYGRDVALSFNDPDDWLRDSDFPEGFFDPHHPSLTMVVFGVAEDGAMIDCRVRQPSSFADFNVGLCDLLKSRAKLVPPVFPEESTGVFYISGVRKPSEKLKLMRR